MNAHTHIYKCENENGSEWKNQHENVKKKVEFINFHEHLFHITQCAAVCCMNMLFIFTSFQAFIH